MTTWLVGEAPVSSEAVAFTGDAGHRLRAIVGFNVHKYFLCTNVFDSPQPRNKNGKGHEFNHEKARPLAKFMVMNLTSPDDRIVIVGHRTKQAFTVRPDLEMMTWSTIFLGTFMTVPMPRNMVQISWIPHPSGVNRWWNDPENAKAVRLFMRRTAREAIG